MLDVVRELVRRVAEATVLEVDEPGDLPVPQHVGRVEVGDAERGEPWLGQHRRGDVGAGGVQRLRDQHRVRHSLRSWSSASHSTSTGTCSRAPYRRGPIPAVRTASTGTSYSRRSDAPTGPRLHGRQRAAARGDRRGAAPSRSPASRRPRGAAVSAPGRRVLGEEHQAGPLPLGLGPRGRRRTPCSLPLPEGQAVGRGLHRATLPSLARRPCGSPSSADTARSHSSWPRARRGRPRGHLGRSQPRPRRRRRGRPGPPRCLLGGGRRRSRPSPSCCPARTPSCGPREPAAAARQRTYAVDRDAAIRSMDAAASPPAPRAT